MLSHRSCVMRHALCAMARAYVHGRARSSEGAMHRRTLITKSASDCDRMSLLGNVYRMGLLDDMGIADG